MAPLKHVNKKMLSGQIHQVSNVSTEPSQRLFSRADAMHKFTETRHLGNTIWIIMQIMLLHDDPNNAQFQKISIPNP